MTRTEALERISSIAADLDDEQLEALVNFTAHLAGSPLPRPLTNAERDLIEQSKVDFREGRTLSGDEVRSFVDDRLTRHGVAKSTA